MHDEHPKAPGRQLLTRRMMLDMLAAPGMPLYFFDVGLTRYFYTTPAPKSLNDFVGREMYFVFPYGTAPIINPQ
jgi:hypothetical protein